MIELPDFPWDRLAPYKELAQAHADGIADLSIGTPVDPVPAVARKALAAAADSPGYPQTYGTARLREAAAGWLRRRHGVTVDPADVLPTIGSKEMVAWLPTLLGAGRGDRVVIPELAYPTYDVGARLTGAEPYAADGLLAVGPERVPLVWVNSPSNPTGRVLPTEHLRKVVAWARERGAVVASDECYLELGWEDHPVSVLHPDVCGDSHEGLLAVHSLSKRSNLAGYRAGFVAGDPALVKRLLEVRKHAGMMVSAPVQAAMAAVLDDDEHADEQRGRYARRREVLRPALERAGWRIDHSTAGLYLWATDGTDCWEQVRVLAEKGILVAPGDFYGVAGRAHVRIALTATDERIDAVVRRLQ
ncbi:succinyldiaminopimelate transaminase [Planotetraspora phitsanulokensis]|uniref:Aminotransferase n=1 Tax=Planotetraspora phitsanulokensis TaxID=575192 RepID=A0A8J3U521_9ACTN|nr:succinyldiaminopimelate transaminase [Planotetraspora phitsanulokensis]GII37306.1 aminotransferase [Planotetraspora phitsanulokensis]